MNVWTVGRAAGIGAAVLLMLAPNGLGQSSTGAAAEDADPVPDIGTPLPVLLVPGWGDDEDALSDLERRLREEGWPAERIQSVSFEDPEGSNREHARELAIAALNLRERTGADRVDVVAHSMGGLATRYYLLNGGAEVVRKIVFLATPHGGTISAYLAWGDGAREMEPGSPFLLGMRRSILLPEGVRAVTIRTPLDFHVIPSESATLPGVPNLDVCCPTHAGLLDHDPTFELIARFLTDPR